MSGCRNEAGRLFQILGLAAEKLLSPNLVCVRGTVRRFLPSRGRQHCVILKLYFQLLQNTPEYKVGRRPGRPNTKHVVVAINFTHQRSFLAAVDNVERAVSQRLRVLPVDEMVAENCHVLLLNDRYNTTTTVVIIIIIIIIYLFIFYFWPTSTKRQA